MKKFIFAIITSFFIGTCGIPGDSGSNCYDDLEDVNGDGVRDSKDCIGPKGDDGKDGPKGNDGKDGKDGKDGTNGPKGKDGKDGKDGKIGEDGKDGKDGENYQPPSLVGYYSLPNGGYIEIITNSAGQMIIYGTQRLYTVNFDAGLALHPKLPDSPHGLTDGILSGEYEPRYDKDDNDVEVDGQQSTDINGKRKTVYKIWKTTEGLLNIQLIVYNSTGLIIDVNRTIKSI